MYVHFYIVIFELTFLMFKEKSFISVFFIFLGEEEKVNAKLLFKKNIGQIFFLYWILHFTENVIDSHDDTYYPSLALKVYCFEKQRDSDFEFNIFSSKLLFMLT